MLNREIRLIHLLVVPLIWSKCWSIGPEAAAEPRRSPSAASAAGLMALAIPERASAPSAVLHRAPHQLEVTVLSIEEKPGPHSGKSIWHRVRVDRVMAGSGLARGDEVAVVSVVNHNPPGTTGSSGDRGPFNGPNGLPRKGDRARLFAEGDATILRPVPPNGWQMAKPQVAFLAADEEQGSDVAMPLLAAAVDAAGFAATSVLQATDGDGRGSPNKSPRAGAKEEFVDSFKLRFTDATVMSVHGLRPSYNAGLALDNALKGGLPIVAFRRSYQELERLERGDAAQPVDLPAPQVAGQFRTRILPPDEAAATHPILAGVTIPAEGLVVPSALIEVHSPAKEWPADRQVLLWAVAEGAPEGGALRALRQPVLWVEERPRAAGSRGGPPQPDLPRQRIAVTTLGGVGDLEIPEFRLAAVQMVAWAIGREDMMTDEARSRVREVSRAAGAKERTR